MKITFYISHTSGSEAIGIAFRLPRSLQWQNKHLHTHTHTDIHTHRHTHTQTDRQTDKPSTATLVVHAHQGLKIAVCSRLFVFGYVTRTFTSFGYSRR